MSENTSSELMSLERAGWAALCRGEGLRFYDEVLADDAMLVVPGAVLDKQQTLASWDGMPPWQWFDLVPREVVDLGDAAIVIYDATAQRVPDPPYRATISSMYVRRPEGWRLRLHQQTPWS